MARPGTRVAQARHAAGLTQVQLADRLGINRVTLARIETDAATPTLEVALRLEAALGVAVWELFAEKQHATMRRRCR